MSLLYYSAAIYFLAIPGVVVVSWALYRFAIYVRDLIKDEGIGMTLFILAIIPIGFLVWLVLVPIGWVVGKVYQYDAVKKTAGGGYIE